MYTYGYDELQRNTTLQFPDGHTRVQKYDAEGRVTSRCYAYTNGSLNRCYTAMYDGVGNPVRLVDPEGTDIVEYDALYRVTKVTRQVAGVTVGVEDYAYNALGALKVNGNAVLNDQRPKLAGGGTADAAVPATPNGQPVALDLGGRVTGLNGFTLGWNGRGLLTQISGPGVSETYGHDAQLRRIARTGSSPEFYVYEGMNRIATLTSTGPCGAFCTGSALKEAYLFDAVDHPLRVNQQGVIVYYELDLAGNVRRLRGSGGADLGGYRYTAFGKAYAADAGTPAASVDQALRWKGRWFSSNAGGIYDVRARQWAPELGLFLSIDEFDFHDPSSTLWGWPGMSPIRRRDPSGRHELVICLQLVPFGNLAELAACLAAPDNPYKQPSPHPSDCDKKWHEAWAACIAGGGSWSKCLAEANAAEQKCLEELGLPSPSPLMCAPPPFVPFFEPLAYVP